MSPGHYYPYNTNAKTFQYADELAKSLEKLYPDASLGLPDFVRDEQSPEPPSSDLAPESSRNVPNTPSPQSPSSTRNDPTAVQSPGLNQNIYGTVPSPGSYQNIYGGDPTPSSSRSASGSVASPRTSWVTYRAVYSSKNRSPPYVAFPSGSTQLEDPPSLRLEPQSEDEREKRLQETTITQLENPPSLRLEPQSEDKQDERLQETPERRSSSSSRTEREPSLSSNLQPQVEADEQSRQPPISSDRPDSPTLPREELHSYSDSDEDPLFDSKDPSPVALGKHPMVYVGDEEILPDSKDLLSGSISDDDLLAGPKEPSPVALGKHPMVYIDGEEVSPYEEIPPKFLSPQALSKSLTYVSEDQLHTLLSPEALATQPRVGIGIEAITWPVYLVPPESPKFTPAPDPDFRAWEPCPPKGMKGYRMTGSGWVEAPTPKISPVGTPMSQRSMILLPPESYVSSEGEREKLVRRVKWAWKKVFRKRRSRHAEGRSKKWNWRRVLAQIPARSRRSLRRTLPALFTTLLIQHSTTPRATCYLSRLLLLQSLRTTLKNSRPHRLYKRHRHRAITLNISANEERLLDSFDGFLREGLRVPKGMKEVLEVCGRDRRWCFGRYREEREVAVIFEVLDKYVRVRKSGGGVRKVTRVFGDKRGVFLEGSGGGGD